WRAIRCKYWPAHGGPVDVRACALWSTLSVGAHEKSGTQPPVMAMPRLVRAVSCRSYAVVGAGDAVVMASRMRAAIGSGSRVLSRISAVVSWRPSARAASTSPPTREVISGGNFNAARAGVTSDDVAGTGSGAGSAAAAAAADSGAASAAVAAPGAGSDAERTRRFTTTRSPRAALADPIRP